MYYLHKRYSEDDEFNHDNDEEEFLLESEMLDRVTEIVKAGLYKFSDIRVLKEIDIMLEVRAAIKPQVPVDPFQRR